MKCALRISVKSNKSACELFNVHNSRVLLKQQLIATTAILIINTIEIYF